jgi:hypothetical protein
LLGKAKSRPPGLNLVFKSGQTGKLESHYSADMPRLLPADKCPKCSGPLKRQPTLVGTIFTCEKCDADDPVKAADNWIKGELKPPE